MGSRWLASSSVSQLLSHLQMRLLLGWCSTWTFFLLFSQKKCFQKKSCDDRHNTDMGNDFQNMLVVFCGFQNTERQTRANAPLSGLTCLRSYIFQCLFSPWCPSESRSSQQHPCLQKLKLSLHYGVYTEGRDSLQDSHERHGTKLRLGLWGEEGREVRAGGFPGSLSENKCGVEWRRQVCRDTESLPVLLTASEPGSKFITTFAVQFLHLQVHLGCVYVTVTDSKWFPKKLITWQLPKTFAYICT